MKDKFVLITGATGGLGISVTKAVLAKQAKQITIPYRSERSLNSLKQSLTNAEINQLNCIQNDLSDEQAIASLITQIPQIDVLIHLVGGFAIGKFEENTLASWQKMFELNLTNSFLLCKYVLPKMKATGYGRIIAVGSRGAVQPSANFSAYSASKSALVSMIQTIAEETKQKEWNITANCVLPSIIDTPNNRASMGDNQAWAWVSPESLAEVICFLASDTAKDIRGVALPVYGKA